MHEIVSHFHTPILPCSSQRERQRGKHNVILLSGDNCIRQNDICYCAVKSQTLHFRSSVSFGEQKIIKFNTNDPIFPCFRQETMQSPSFTIVNS